MKIIFIFLFFIFLSGCHHDQKVSQTNNICQLLSKNPHWLWATEKAQKRWRVPMSLMMAIINQESHFQRGAEPKRKWLWHKIPWFRPTSAEGFAQATDETWYVYCKSRHRLSANRDNFSDAVDFVGWYINYAHQKIRIAKNDPYAAYLVYHEGPRGFSEKSYRHKYWLLHVARKVKKQAWRYHHQLTHCLKKLPKPPWWY
jgi:hypothetical protein